jgi:hypothetical protein
MRLTLGLLLFLSVTVTLAQNPHADLSKRVISRREKPIASWINPHVSEVNVLIVDGKRFEHVRGLNQFFLRIPKTNAIVFVSDEKDYTITYHVYNLDSGEDIQVHARGSIFGNTIGSAKPRDSIEDADQQSVILCNFDPSARSTLPSLMDLAAVKSLYVLDLHKKSVTEKTTYLDKDGKVIRERVFEPKPTSLKDG